MLQIAETDPEWQTTDSDSDSLPLFNGYKTKTYRGHKTDVRTLEC